VSYNALLTACVSSDDADRALDVIDRMAADGVAPDELTLAAVARKRSLRAYLRKRLG
jgi:pentatricopeptide repeat protein